jgi:hypothetical protein
MRSLSALRRRIAALASRLPGRRRLQRIIVPVVSRPDQDGPLLLNAMYVIDLSVAPPPVDDSTGIDNDGSIWGTPLKMTDAQRAAWRSTDEVERFPQSSKEKAIWRAFEKENLR